ncbi:MAG: hypothetical protein K5773_05600 [Pseudobutyrivibrio sp.]|nr:hypothetical protein [Pseudobutyrivibrio sp.]
MNDLFREKLDFQLSLGTEPTASAFVDLGTVATIDLRNCSYQEFTSVMDYLSKNHPEYKLDENLYGLFKPSFEIDSQNFDFIALIKSSIITASSAGNVEIFKRLSTLVNACEDFQKANHPDPVEIDEKKLLSLNSIVNLNVHYDLNDLEVLGVCIVGLGDINPYKLTAVRGDSNGTFNPIVLVQAYSLSTGEYMPEIKRVDIESIDKRDATLLEAFAYLSFRKYTDPNYMLSFDDLLNKSSYEYITLDDMSLRKIDLVAFEQFACPGY